MSAYTKQNQQETADKVRWAFEGSKNLASALRMLAHWADWEADDPKSICLNVATYLEGGVPTRGNST